MRHMLFVTLAVGLLGGCVVEGQPATAPAYAQAAPPAVPVERVEVVPAPPSAAVIWQPGEWHWNGATFVWHPGHYVQRVAYYHHWVRGHWAGPGVWVPGHWA